MAKRQKTDTVQLKLRIREALRHRLETAAQKGEKSLNSEMADRLAASFDESRHNMFVDVLLGSESNRVLLQMIATVLKAARQDWYKNNLSALAVADAINKVTAVFIGELPPNEETFAQHKDKTSSDHLAWLAILVSRFQLSAAQQLRGDDK